MLRVAGRRLSSLPWRSSQSPTTSAFVSRNTAFVSDDGRDSAASSRPILSPYQFSFPPDLIRGHLFLSSDLGLASFFFFNSTRFIYIYSISGFRRFLYWKNEYRLPQTTLKVFFFVCYDVCLIVWCPISSQADLGFRVCYNLWIEWKIFHGFVMSFYIFVLFFFRIFFRILSTIICSNLQYFEVLSFTFVFSANLLLLLY